MYCPECGAEFRPGFDRCNECDVPLTHDPPPEADHEVDDPYVRVFATSEADVIPVIKSFLQSAEIPFETDGEAMMNLFPSDLLGPVLSRPRGEVRFHVPESRAQEARELFAERPRAFQEEEELAPEGDGDSEELDGEEPGR